MAVRITTLALCLLAAAFGGKDACRRGLLCERGRERRAARHVACADCLFISHKPDSTRKLRVGLKARL